jgi:hypothetical protein
MARGARQRETKSMYGAWIQRIFARHATDAIRAE